MNARRHSFSVVTLLIILSVVVLAACQKAGTTAHPVDCLSMLTQTSSVPVPNQCRKRILVFSKTAAFRHASIPDGKIALQALASEYGFSVDFTEDSTVFTEQNLARYNAVVFLLTTGEIFDTTQEAAFRHYIESGGGFVGIHSASDTLYSWPWYGGLVGSYNNVADKHSSIQPAILHIEDPNTPSTDMLPTYWMRTDEWYNFAINPRKNVHVLLTVDERSYKGGIMGADHPLSWYHQYDGGRAWYTAMGHTSATYYEPLFRDYLWGGVLYAVGLWPGHIAAGQFVQHHLQSHSEPFQAATIRRVLYYSNAGMTCCCC